MRQTLSPGRITGNVTIPASKSHTVRAILIAAAASGESELLNPLLSADTRAALDTASALGAKITESGNDLIIRGTAGMFTPPARAIDVKNSGTTLYLAAGMAALTNKKIRFTGDAQIRSRPIENLLQSLRDFGARAFSENNNGCAPISVEGPLRGGNTTIECPTSQFLSSLIIACPLALGDSIIDVPLLFEKPYVEMTLSWLDSQGIKYENDDFRRFIIPGKQHYRSFKKYIPADFSSAAFFLTAAAITGSKVYLKGLDLGDSQGDKAVLPMLEKMGCLVVPDTDGIWITGPGYQEAESINSLNKTLPLRGGDFDLNDTPDALPAMAVAACYAAGTTRLFNVPQARLKETDRISVMREELSKMGADITELEDGLLIRGRSLKGTTVNGHGDHRVVMALAVAALKAAGKTTIEGSEVVDITFPGFFDLLEKHRIRQ